MAQLNFFQILQQARLFRFQVLSDIPLNRHESVVFSLNMSHTDLYDFFASMPVSVMSSKCVDGFMINKPHGGDVSWISANVDGRAVLTRDFKIFEVPAFNLFSARILQDKETITLSFNEDYRQPLMPITMGYPWRMDLSLQELVA